MPLRRVTFALLILWPATLWAGKAIPPSPPSYVLNEGVVSPDEENKLSGTLRGFEQATGHQFVVALFQSLDGENLEDYSNRVFRAWRTGDAKRNDGLLFCLFKQDRKWRVEVGYGLEGVLTDLQAGEIARGWGVPYFRRGDFDGGVQAVVEALAAKLSGGSMPARADGGARRNASSRVLLLIIGWVLFLMIVRFLKVPYGPVHIGGGRRTFPEDFSGRGGGGFGGFSGGGGSSGGGGASGGW